MRFQTRVRSVRHNGLAYSFLRQIQTHKHTHTHRCGEHIVEPPPALPRRLYRLVHNATRNQTKALHTKRLFHLVGSCLLLAAILGESGSFLLTLILLLCCCCCQTGVGSESPHPCSCEGSVQRPWRVLPAPFLLMRVFYCILSLSRSGDAFDYQCALTTPLALVLSICRSNDGLLRRKVARTGTPGVLCAMPFAPFWNDLNLTDIVIPRNPVVMHS
jgi:hypothetical protein